eukprot:CAMPEP_0178572600 /NCGR_PEP_ID=MMETSP0697-20121206/18307_1 /TAXON_ID=265572 /ORGANISM="Extubocellulus spinifer, Strain CCMP396" /LENGTH=35 /DNA_ID= /DNA_START= /DNA_END= /DNA_ORIENTATION=
MGRKCLHRDFASCYGEAAVDVVGAADVVAAAVDHC